MASDFIGLDISASGMAAQRMRLRVISENLANQQTVGPDGPYQRKEVVLRATPIENPFDAELARALDEGKSLHSVSIGEVREDDTPPLRKYDPSHPYADAEGFVEYPDISIFREMTDMVEASRSYEANLAAAKATQDMLMAALDMLRR